jgi:hypothetical protein
MLNVQPEGEKVWTTFIPHTETHASTDWNMFRESSDGFEEYTTSVMGFNNKCIDDIVPTVTVHTPTRSHGLHATSALS